MATLTLPSKSLGSLAPHNRRSMDQEVRAVLQQLIGDRLALLDEIECSWARQIHRSNSHDVDSWIQAGRP